jgi:hypothetical protein
MCTLADYKVMGRFYREACILALTPTGCADVGLGEGGNFIELELLKAQVDQLNPNSFQAASSKCIALHELTHATDENLICPPADNLPPSSCTEWGAYSAERRCLIDAMEKNCDEPQNWLPSECDAVNWEITKVGEEVQLRECQCKAELEGASVKEAERRCKMWWLR